MKIVLSLFLILAIITVIKTNYSFKKVTSNPYRILGVQPWSSMKDIKKKYNLLVLKYHPDKSTLPNAKEKFIEIQESYEKIKISRENETEEKAISDIVMEAIQTAFIYEGILFIVMYCCWFLYKFSYFFFQYGIFFIFYMLLNETILPHWYKNVGKSMIWALIYSVITFQILIRLKQKNNVVSFHDSQINN